jgi:hypothetical protein
MSKKYIKEFRVFNPEKKDKEQSDHLKFIEHKFDKKETTKEKEIVKNTKNNEFQFINCDFNNNKLEEKTIDDNNAVISTKDFKMYKIPEKNMITKTTKTRKRNKTKNKDSKIKKEIEETIISEMYIKTPNINFNNNPNLNNPTINNNNNPNINQNEQILTHNQFLNFEIEEIDKEFEKETLNEFDFENHNLEDLIITDFYFK